MGKTSLLVQFDQGKFIPGSFSATVGIGFTVRVRSLVPGLCNLAHPWGSSFIRVIVIYDSMIFSGAKHKELGEFSLVMLDEGPCLAMCLLASWGQVCFRLLGGDGGQTRLHIPKPSVGLCLSAAFCIAPRKLPLEWPCSPGEKPACVLPVWPGALVKSQADGSSAWEQHSAAIQRYLQRCRGAGEQPQRMCPLSWGSLGQRQLLGPHRTAGLASLQHPWQGWGSA